MNSGTLYDLGREVSALTERLESVDARMTSGFDNLEKKLDRALAKLEEHSDAIRALEANEKRRAARAKWLSGVAATVVGAVLLWLVGLR